MFTATTRPRSRSLLSSLLPLIAGMPGVALVSAAVALTHYLRMHPAVQDRLQLGDPRAGRVGAVLIMRLVPIACKSRTCSGWSLPVLARLLVYYFIDTGLIAAAIRLASGARPGRHLAQAVSVAGRPLPGVVSDGPLPGDRLYQRWGRWGVHRLHPAGADDALCPAAICRADPAERVQELKRMNEELAQANRNGQRPAGDPAAQRRAVS